MPIPTRVIKRRIKSIRSTRKIMKAMELVAASKMRKATQLTLATRPYATQLQTLTADVRRRVDAKDHPWLVGRPSSNAVLKTLVVLASSDRGLCGGFNNQLGKKAQEFFKTRGNQDVQVVTIGRRSEMIAKRSGRVLAASFESISNAPSFERTRPVIKYILESFTNGTFDRVFIVYTDYRSALSHIPTVAQLLPVIPEEELEKTEVYEHTNLLEYTNGSGEFEPSPSAVLDALLPRLLEIQIYQALLESAASEHSARMLAMRSAGDAASDMLSGLTLTLNQARQASITREISEISAGKAAIE